MVDEPEEEEVDEAPPLGQRATFHQLPNRFEIGQVAYCPRCKGKGRYKERDCYRCNGYGVVPNVGSIAPMKKP